MFNFNIRVSILFIFRFKNKIKAYTIFTVYVEANFGAECAMRLDVVTTVNIWDWDSGSIIYCLLSSLGDQSFNFLLIYFICFDEKYF